MTREGATEQITARVLGDVPFADDFASSSAAAVEGWLCAPAWRLDEPGEPPGQVFLDYPTAIVFRFAVDTVSLGAKN